jgi:ABC-type nitrate/sulfonate/bicarbonate transport system permease component
MDAIKQQTNGNRAYAQATGDSAGVSSLRGLDLSSRELDHGILSFTWLSLKLVAQGYVIALLVGTPIGFFLGLSKTFSKMFDPIFQVLRYVSPLAWLPLGMVIFLGAKLTVPGLGVTHSASDLAAIFTIAICSIWPTVLNTAVGVSPPWPTTRSPREGSKVCG